MTRFKASLGRIFGRRLKQCLARKCQTWQ